MNEKRIVFITAGASGLGREMAITFRNNGYLVAISDINKQSLSKIDKDENNIFPYFGDASNENDMLKITRSIIKKFKKIDVLVANAGIAGPTALCHEINFNDWKECVAINLHGAFLACKFSIPSMLSKQKGSIIITSSTAGLFGYPYRSPYASAKWGMIGLMKTLAMELGPNNIRVNAICPGAVEGDRMERVISNASIASGIPKEKIKQDYSDCSSLKRFVGSDDIAEMALFLASEKSKNISGMAMSVDGNTEKIC